MSQLPNINGVSKFSVLLCALHTLAGCHVVHQKEQQPTVETHNTAIVNVGGLVEHPGSLWLGPTVGTLSDALSAVGGVATPGVVTSQRPVKQDLKDLLQQLISYAGEIPVVAREIVTANPGVKIRTSELKSPDANGRFLRLDNDLTFGIQDLEIKLSEEYGELSAAPLAKWDVLKLAIRQVKNGTATLQTITEMERLARDVQEAIKLVMQGLASQADVRSPSFNFGRSTSDDHLLVQLKRVTASGTTSHYFPLPCVESGFASGILLRQGDAVFVKEPSQTVLGSPQSLFGTEFGLTGFVKKPARYTQAKLTTLGDIREEIVAGIDKRQTVVVIDRRSPGGSGVDTFVIPFDSIRSLSAFEGTPTQPQDSIKVVPYFQAPLIAETLSSASRHQQFASRVDRIVASRPVLNHHDEKQVWIQKKFRSAKQNLTTLLR